MTGANGDADDVARAPWIPGPRRSADDHADLTSAPPMAPETPANPETPETPVTPVTPVTEVEAEEPPDVPQLTHRVLKSLLGAWALSACSAGETKAVEDHLTECAPCAEEALRLRDAVALLHEDRDLDLDPLLRSRVLENCLGRRPARVPVPEWVTPYDAETARLDALLRDIGESEWHAPVRLKWYENDHLVRRKTTVAGVIGHLLAVDGLVSSALGIKDPLGAGVPELSPTERTEAFWSALDRPPNRALRGPWRDQTHTLIRTVSFAGRGVGDLTVTYKDFALPLRDSLLERAFECWLHADDIANAVAYPYAPPSGAHLHGMIDLAARLRRRPSPAAGAAASPPRPGSSSRRVRPAARSTWRSRARAAATGTSRWTPRRRSARRSGRWRRSRWTGWSSASWWPATSRRRRPRRARTATGRPSATSCRRRPPSVASSPRSGRLRRRRPCGGR